MRIDTGKRETLTPSFYSSAGSVWNLPYLESEIRNSFSVFNVLRDMASPYCLGRTVKDHLSCRQFASARWRIGLALLFLRGFFVWCCCCCLCRGFFLRCLCA